MFRNLFFIFSLLLFSACQSTKKSKEELKEAHDARIQSIKRQVELAAENAPRRPTTLSQDGIGLLTPSSSQIPTDTATTHLLKTLQNKRRKLNYSQFYGLNKKESEALYLSLNKKARSGDKEALHRLALFSLYLEYKATRKLAKNGDPDAQYKLGIMYKYGTGCNRSTKRCWKWLSKAADQDHNQAYQVLRFMTKNGDFKHL